MADRQNKRTDKTRFPCLLENQNYDFLYRQAEEQDLSMSAMLNKIIREMRQST